MSNKKVQTSAQNLSELDMYTHTIKDSITSISKEFLNIGRELWFVKDQELYKLGGYKNISDYALDQFNFKKRSTYNFIAIVEKFCVFDKVGDPTHELKSDYKDFNYSQLTEMLRLDEEQKKLASTDMTVKQIRNLKKDTDPLESVDDNVIDVSYSDASESQSYIPSEKFAFEQRLTSYLEEKIAYYKSTIKSFSKGSEYHLMTLGRIDAYDEIRTDLIRDSI